MKKERRRFEEAEKVKIIREHILDKRPLSEVCEQYGIAPTLNCRHTDFQRV
ncbi:MAG TPA: transposase [Anaerohalosphaeraceae bacterium]|nr:transposase [Phycisphaerae bacterium]HOK94664.1 transposase [Anaerohalosphaeraceae bacterium]HOL31352.1 transposase [Anaerohalosphaeraceae bacterium]HOM76621.1 transposase [Anaerohalosphaeraceae bacterium]HPC63573.1 transposase [Anaerohalosphaeraceae bacterium]